MNWHRFSNNSLATRSHFWAVFVRACSDLTWPTNQLRTGSISKLVLTLLLRLVTSHITALPVDRNQFQLSEQQTWVGKESRYLYRLPMSLFTISEKGLYRFLTVSNIQYIVRQITLCSLANRVWYDGMPEFSPITGWIVDAATDYRSCRTLKFPAGKSDKTYASLATSNFCL